MSQAPFPNSYRFRTSTAEGSCFVCHKLTTALLITDPSSALQPTDWFYCCVRHAKDPSVCTLLNPIVTDPEPSTPMTKTSGSKPLDNPEDTKTSSPKDPPSEKTTQDKEKPTETSASEGGNLAPTPAAREPSRFRLHRNLMYLRESQYQQKVDYRKAQEMLQQSPSVPSK
ncbi:hypothetical protein IWQ62_005369 [Dispira parvispora]|uniref:VPS4-associated protein 1 n=1 Tax=Dispira parvispora TaxID=1520584 RepID=A0A9W8AR50_9FUNG|nr:hypothetical protein IWQ62_005369 [Dispira parvispora]